MGESIIDLIRNPPPSVVVEAMLGETKNTSWLTHGLTWLKSKIEEIEESDHGN